MKCLWCGEEIKCRAGDMPRAWFHVFDGQTIRTRIDVTRDDEGKAVRTVRDDHVATPKLS